MVQNLFSVPIFFVLFRETLEAAIVVSILLSFIRQVFHEDHIIQRRLNKQVWIGTGIGLGISIAIGVAFIAVWYTVASNLWSTSEDLWEGSFSLLATVLVTVMGLAMLKTNKMQEKIREKLARAMEIDQSNIEDEVEKKVANKFGKRYALLLLPLITVLREGLEAMVFLGGLSIGEPPSSIPIAAVCGILAGTLVGLIIYKGGNLVQLHWFFVTSTCILLLIAAGLFSKAIGSFESHAWMVYTGGPDSDNSGDATYPVRGNIWHMSCCNPEDSNNGGWGIFNAILGWSNSASVGTITGYCLYWGFIIVTLIIMKKRDRMIEKKKADKALGDAEIEKVDEAFTKN